MNDKRDSDWGGSGIMLVITHRSIRSESAGEMFCMVVYLVFRCAIRENSNIGVVAVGQDAHMLFFKGGG